MLTILICWAIAGVLGWLFGRAIKNAHNVPEEKEAAAVADVSNLCDLMLNGTESPLSEILAGAMREAKGRGVSSRHLLFLDCCQRHALAGDLETGTAVYLLERMGLWEWAEKAKGAGV